MSTSTPSTTNAAGFRLAVVIEGSLGLLAIALAWLFGVSLRDEFAATARGMATGTLIGVVATLPMLALFWALMHGSWQPLVELRRNVVQMVRELFPSGHLAELATITALAGVGEELLFRGLLQTLVGRWTTPVIGLSVAALAFGGVHAISRLYFVLATLIGAYLGWLLLKSGDLTVPIVAHGLYDFVALVYLTRQSGEAPQ